MELLLRSHYDLHRLTEELATADSLSGIDTMETNPVPILYQSGYLTIKGYDKRFRTYTLGFPNREVEEGFVKFLLPFIWLHQKLIRHLKLSVKKKNRTPISPVLSDGRSIRRISRPRVLPAGGRCRKPMSRIRSCWHTPRPDHTTRP